MFLFLTLGKEKYFRLARFKAQSNNQEEEAEKTIKSYLAMAVNEGAQDAGGSLAGDSSGGKKVL